MVSHHFSDEPSRGRSVKPLLPASVIEISTNKDEDCGLKRVLRVVSYAVVRVVSHHFKDGPSRERSAKPSSPTSVIEIWTNKDENCGLGRVLRVSCGVSQMGTSDAVNNWKRSLKGRRGIEKVSGTIFLS